MSSTSSGKRNTRRDLQDRIDKLRKDFAAQKGYEFQHFFCPILHRDDDVEIIRGHIINEKFGNCNVWVPQRKDIDNFYGTNTEADFVAIIEDRTKHPIEILLDPSLSKKHRPQIQVSGRSIEHYHAHPEHERVKEHTGIDIIFNDGVTISNIVLKVPSDELASLSDRKFELIIEKDYRPAAIASVLKCAHLTLFSMLGYQYVFSPSGHYLADILRKFYRENQNLDRKAIRKNLALYFLDFRQMVIPILCGDNSTVVRGTAIDNRTLACACSSGGFFAMGVIAKALDDMFCVFIPDDDGARMNTYFSFLKEPPEFISVRLAQFCAGDHEHSVSHWKVESREPRKLIIPRTSIH